MKKLAFLAAAVLSTTSYSSTWEQVKKNKVIRVATDATYPPMEFEGPDGKVTGFDIQMVEALAQEMGVKAEIKIMAWDGILAGLDSGRYDIIVSSMSITDDRKKAADFVQYMQMSQVFVSKASKLIKSETELAGLRVAVQADTTSHELVKKLVGDKKIAIKDIKAFRGATEAFGALKAGQADVIVIDEPVGLYYAKKDSKNFVISGKASSPEPIGIAVKKSDGTLTAELSKALESIRKKGTFKKISQDWFGTEI
jgi:ABC-type amino acid transport substrate-binding protein